MKSSDLSLIFGFILLLFYAGGGNVPGPGPGPAPDPVPVVVEAAPFPSERLSVLVVRDTAAAMKPGQAPIVFDGAVREWLKGQGAEAYFFDPATDMSRMPENWQQAMKVSRPSLPWLLISNKTRGFSGPLPETVDSFKAIVEKLK